MKLNGQNIRDRQKEEIDNIAAYLEQHNSYVYEFVAGALRKIEANLSLTPDKNTKVKMTKERVSPEETAIVGLAIMHFRSKAPSESDSDYLEAIAEYQYTLQRYLGLENSPETIRYYNELTHNIKPEHNNLIPTLHTYHTQIHALQLGYDALKGKVSKGTLVQKLLFGLLCVEFMKLHVRLYIIEPLARSEAGKNLDWIYMLDSIFQDYRIKSAELRYDKLDEMMSSIRAIRDSVAETKRQKALAEKIAQKAMHQIMNYTTPPPPSA